MVYEKEFLDERGNGFKVTFNYKACFVYFKVYVDRYENRELINRVEFNFSVFCGIDGNIKVVEAKNTESVYKKYAVKCLESLYSSGIYDRIKPSSKYYVYIENNSDFELENGSIRTVFFEDTQNGLGEIYKVDIPAYVIDAGIGNFIPSRDWDYIVLSIWENEQAVQIRDTTDYFSSRHSKELEYAYSYLTSSRIPSLVYELENQKIVF